MTTGRRRRPSFGRREVVILAVALLVLAAGVAVAVTFMLKARQVGTIGNSTSPSASAATASTAASAAASPSPANTSLTLESIFDKQPDLGGIDQKRVVTMIATGDVIPGRRVNGHMVAMNDFLWPFKPTHDYLHSADFVFINLESPLVPGCAVNNGHTTTFCGDPRFIDGLTYAGVSVVNLSNNHISNAGGAGVTSTEKLLSDHGIQYTGLGFTPTITVKGVKFGFVGFNGVTGGAGVDKAELKREIQLLRPTVDVVIAQFHWGAEYKLVPQAAAGVAPDDPRDIGHAAIDDGADLVIGNHPHTVEGVEIYKGHLITYAHGNYVFDQDAPWWVPDPGQPDAADGVLGKYTFVDGKLAAVKYSPIRTYTDGQPRFLTGSTQAYGDYVMSLMKLSSQIIAGQAPPQPVPSPTVPRPPSGN
ncbi:MAG TPA: CapA family protein [Candidatus Dormibacteraeota bacterium]|nr:CapA family protein [Candidatus Dormibacteraeota bacterium]